MLENCFLICSKEVNLQSMHKKRVCNGYIYFDHIRLNEFKNYHGECIYIIGEYFFCRDDLSEATFTNLDASNVSNILSALLGNYVMIYKGFIYPDATCQLGLEYCNYNGSVVISNNYSVFKEIGVPLVQFNKTLNFHPTNTVDKRFKGTYGNKYYIPPCTQYSNVKSLRPSEIISIEGKVIQNSLLHYSSPDKNLTSHIEILNLFSNYIVTFLKNLSKHSLKNNNIIYIPLTSGYDCRVLLAAAKKANIKVKTFTICRDKAISRSDLTLPPILAKLCNYEHFKVNVSLGNNIQQNLLDKWNTIVGQNHIEVDREYFIRDVYSFANSGDYIITGHGFELGNKNLNPPSWFKNDQVNVSSSDTVYMYGVLGSWLRYITSSFTVHKSVHRIYPLNCRDLLCNIMNLDCKVRADFRNQFNVKLVETLCPELNNYKYN